MSSPGPVTACPDVSDPAVMYWAYCPDGLLIMDSAARSM